RARRYEAACMRRLQWALGQLKAGRHANRPAPDPDLARAPSSSGVMPAGVQAISLIPVPQTEAPPGGSGRSEVALEVEPEEAARVELEAERDTQDAARVEPESTAEVTAEALPGRDDAPISGPAVKGLAPMSATVVPCSRADG